jgi:hypothetical protein
MDKRAMLLKHLAQTERDIAGGKRLIENQERIIAELEGGGRDTWTVKAFLEDRVSRSNPSARR